MYSVSQKIPPEYLWQFFRTVGNFSTKFYIPIRHSYLRWLQILTQLSATLTKLPYALLSVTTQFISCVQTVHHRPKHTVAFSDIFPKQFGLFGSNFTNLLHVPIYARLQIFIKLSPTITKLCHIKHDHPVHIMCAKCPPSAKTLGDGVLFSVDFFVYLYLCLFVCLYLSLFLC